jgi:hypothetical protein
LGEPKTASFSATSVTAPAYTAGITIFGADVDNFLKRFPNIDPPNEVPYRKLLKAKH